MRLLNVKHIILTETGVHYRKHYKAHAEFVNSIGNTDFDFEFCMEKDAIGKKIITINLSEDISYPQLTIKKQLKEWVKDNISI